MLALKYLGHELAHVPGKAASLTVQVSGHDQSNDHISENSKREPNPAEPEACKSDSP